MLTDRLAAFITGHDPGWRLPQLSVLAKRFNVTLVDVECAIRELARRHLVRELPDGRHYRTSPADYIISLEGLPGIGASIDPLGASISCASRSVAWKRPPEGIALMLGLPLSAEASVIRCQWTVNGAHAAVSTSYVAGSRDDLDGVAAGEARALGAVVSQAPPAVPGPAAGAGPVPAVVHLEMQAPPPGLARSLDLAPGEPAITMTVRFCDPSSRRPVALTAVALRADLFRITLDALDIPGSHGYALDFSADLVGQFAEPEL